MNIARRSLILIPALLLILSACGPPTLSQTVINKILGIFGAPPAPQQVIRDPSGQLRDCTAIIHYPDHFTTTPAGGGVEANGEFVPAHMLPPDWNTYCSKLPAVVVTKINQALNVKTMSTVHYVTLHRCALEASWEALFPRWVCRYEILNMNASDWAEQWQAWYLVGLPRP